jgi:hypothetical protein
MSDDNDVSRHEQTYRRATKLILICFGLWILDMVWLFFWPPGINEKSFLYIAWLIITLSIFGAVAVLSIVSMIAYVRWTGKTPYYFFFRASRDRVRELRRIRESHEKK